MMDPSGGIASEAFYTTSDGGRSWSFVANVNNPNTQTSAQLAGVANPTAWLAAFLGPGPAASGRYTQLKATQDGGKTWEWTPTVLAGAFVDQVSFAGSTGLGIINQSGCRSFKTNCYTNIGLFQTVDNGAHWQQVCTSPTLPPSRGSARLSLGIRLPRNRRVLPPSERTGRTIRSK
jgi:photosystem II stability/assembly factor-like uncharacterized protein